MSAPIRSGSNEINICCDTSFPGAACKVADLGASLIACAVNNVRRHETGLWLVSTDVTGERDGRI
jgi:hypothetical protein